MKKLLLLCILAIAVAGCSPSEKSIQKAIARGDDQYVREYLNNPKYWNDPNKSAVNAIALEGLVLLNQIDNAVAFYKVNKGTPKEDMIVKAFVNALAKSKPQKMPEKLVELVDDDRNNASDALLRKTTVEIEPSLGISKIKTNIDGAIDRRTKEELNSSVEFTKKAVLWDVKSKLREPLNILLNQYSAMKDLYSSKASNESSLNSSKGALSSKKDEVAEQKHEVREKEMALNRLYSGNLDYFQVVGLKAVMSPAWAEDLGQLEPMEYLIHVAKKNLQEENGKLANKVSELKEIENDIKNYEKGLSEDETKLKVKIPEVAAAEAALLAKIEEAGQKN